MDVHLVDRPTRGELQQNEIARQWQPHRDVVDHDPADDRVSNSEGIEMAADRVSIHDAESSMHRE